MEPIKTVNPNSCYGFSGLVVFRQTRLFEYGFIHCIRVINVLDLLLYLRFCHGLTKGKIVRIMCFGIVNHAKLCVFYRVLMCLKVVIEDQVEDTKFAQEKLKKNTFSALFQHVPRQQLNTSRQTLETYYLLEHQLDTSSIAA